jgi:hypothetical protein
VILTASSSDIPWHRVHTIICYDHLPSSNITICDELRHQASSSTAPMPTSMTPSLPSSVTHESPNIQLLSLRMMRIPLTALPCTSSSNNRAVGVPSNITSYPPFTYPLRLFISDDAFERLSPVCLPNHTALLFLSHAIHTYICVYPYIDDNEHI